jgi:hypothetical protein
MPAFDGSQLIRLPAHLGRRFPAVRGQVEWAGVFTIRPSLGMFPLTPLADRDAIKGSTGVSSGSFWIPPPDSFSSLIGVLLLRRFLRNGERAKQTLPEIASD